MRGRGCEPYFHTQQLSQYRVHAPLLGPWNKAYSPPPPNSQTSRTLVIVLFCAFYFHELLFVLVIFDLWFYWYCFLFLFSLPLVCLSVSLSFYAARLSIDMSLVLLVLKQLLHLISFLPLQLFAIFLVPSVIQGSYYITYSTSFSQEFSCIWPEPFLSKNHCFVRIADHVSTDPISITISSDDATDNILHSRPT